MLKLLLSATLVFACCPCAKAAPDDMIAASDSAKAALDSVKAVPDNQYGLKFVSHEDIKDNRTSLAITPDEAMRLKGDFSLSFDVRFRAAEHTFGYVFRIVVDDRESFNMVSEMTVGNPTVSFTDDDATLVEFTLRDSLGRPAYDRWMHVRVAHEAREIVIEVDGVQKRLPVAVPASHFKLWFGACDHPDFYTTDVPPIDLRNVKITSGAKVLRDWELGRHDGDMVWDARGRHAARATNPVWILDRYAHWNKRVSTTLPAGYVNMAADAARGVIYFAQGDNLATYDNGNPDKLTILKALNRMPFTPKAQQMVWDQARERLVVYDFETRSTAMLSPDEKRWVSAATTEPFPRYWHHNAAFVPSLDAIVTFGGYGEHTYKSTLTAITPEGEWSTHELAETIPPRYLGGMAVTDEGNLIVAGGYGSASGLQSESPHNFYDIWRIDPCTGESEEVGEIVRPSNDEHFVFGRDMVMSADGKTLYALIYSDKRYASEIDLVGIDLASGRMTHFADTVPYSFSDIASFCTLVYDRARNEFLLVAMRMADDDVTSIEIWSLENSPLAIADTTQKHRSSAEWWLLGILVVFGLGAGAALMRQKLAGGHKSVDPNGALAESPDYHKTYRVEKKPSSILLLGGFQVVDRHGDDITGHFTHTVRQLFLLILLETYKNGRGISSQRLSDTLWFDKDPDNARNNRNVNIHKLRTLLDEVGHTDLSSKNSYWQLELGEDIFCDYSSLLEASRRVGNGGEATDEEVTAMVSLASLGKLLPNIQTEWSDGYKADFSSHLIEQLMRIANSERFRENPQMRLRIADAVLVHDNLDEDAMRMKCVALTRMGKRNQARQAYNTFVADYRKTLDSSPNFRFEDVVR